MHLINQCRIIFEWLKTLYEDKDLIQILTKPIYNYCISSLNSYSHYNPMRFKLDFDYDNQKMISFKVKIEELFPNKFK